MRQKKSESQETVCSSVKVLLRVTINCIFVCICVTEWDQHYKTVHHQCLFSYVCVLVCVLVCVCVQLRVQVGEKMSQRGE